MLSLLPNERTGDHRDKPSLARPAVHTFLPTVHFTHLKLFVPKGLASFFSHLCHSLSSPSGIVFSHSGSPFPHSTTTTSHSSRVGGLSFSLETHTHTHTHRCTHTHTNSLPRYWRQSHYTMPHYCSNVPSQTSIHSSLSSYREGFNLKQ